MTLNMVNGTVTSGCSLCVFSSLRVGPVSKLFKWDDLLVIF